MMEFKVNRIVNPNLEKYSSEKYDLAVKFAREIYREFGRFLKAVVIFGSAVRDRKKGEGDIDVLCIVDDVEMVLTPELIDTYRIVTERTIRKVSTRLHVISLKFTVFWEYARAADPIAVNILRDGVPLIDSGFFAPVQRLLFMGRIRPTPEAIQNYFVRSPITLQNSKWHILRATSDLYWAVIDSAHAGLMHMGEVPPSPAHVADLLELKMVPRKAISKRDVDVVRQFYKLYKMIENREIREIKGEQFDKYYLEAYEFVNKMKSFLESKV